jgi:uncharacterized protein (DUF433 family)
MSNTRLEDLASRLETADGELRIAGTGVLVRDVFVLNSVEGQTAEDILYRYPMLTMEDAEAAIVCGWVNRERLQRELQQVGIEVPSLFIRPSDRLAAYVGTTWIVLVLLLLSAGTWSKIEFSRLPNPANVNFLEWLIGQWPISGAVVLFALVLCNLKLMQWFLPWSTKFPGRSFPIIGAFAVGTALAFGFCSLDLFTLSQIGEPLWNRRAWETRGVMVPLVVLLGAMIGGLVLQVRMCRRTFVGKRLHS